MKKILVIEDEVSIRETVSEILEISNYEVIQAENGKAGYELAVKSYPDLVICDMMMPRMDGTDTIAAFRSHSFLKYIPFVFLSALSEVSDIRHGMNLGAEDYLTKPFNAKELLAVIDLQFEKLKKNRNLSKVDNNHQIVEVIKEMKNKATVHEKKWLDYLQSAGNIQKVILPKAAELNDMFGENFVYYKPKYSVSGDFYWAQDFGDEKLIAVADCTGHGIAASLLTICCYNELNLAVKEYGLRKPKEIIEKVNELVLTFMHEHGRSHNEVGMDILICAINKKEKTITYAGAKRPLYMVTKELKAKGNIENKNYNQKQSRSLYKLRGSLYTVGSTNKRVNLKEETIAYEPGDTIYLSSDGYGDQFGGPSDKCFKTRNLIQLLLSIQNENLKKQKKIISDSFDSWKGDCEQTDDVTLLGIKL
mgnify:CR=1 FL=1